MRILKAMRLRLVSLFRRNQVDQELDDELRYHLDRLIEENLATGMPAEEARFAALRAMGGLEQRREECRDTRGWRWLDDLAWDLRFAFRTLRKSPLFTIAAVVSLALGIGANAAIFSAVNSLLFRPLPYPQPDRLVWIDEEGRSSGISSVTGVSVADWSEHSRTLDAIAAYNTEDMTLTGVGEPEQLEAFQVSAGFFPTLGTSMLLGRSFLSTDMRDGAEPVAVLSHRLWHERFGSEPEVVGRSIRLNDRGYRVVGVLPQEFRFLERRDLWVPLTVNEAELRGPRQMLLEVFARLKPEITREQAATELETIRSAYRENASDLPDGRVRLTPLHDHLLVGGTHRLLLLLLGAVALILAIACANVANLLLARSVVRQKQLAICSALGAGRSRLVRQMLAESGVLALGGGACGLVLAWVLTKVLMVVAPPDTFGEIWRVATIDIDVWVLCYMLLVSLLSGMFFGLAPALQFSLPDLTGSLKEGARTPFSPRCPTRQVLLVAQVALAVVLLIGAGLLLHSFVNVFRVEPGFRPENLLTLRIEVPYERYPDHAHRARFQQLLLESTAALPGVERVGAITNLPLTGVGNIATFEEDGGVNGRPIGPVVLGMASSDYFRTMGISLRSGRSFERRDADGASAVAILNETLARDLFPGQDPLGRSIPFPFEKPATVVGIVEDVRRQGLDGPIMPEMYLPYQQMSIGLMTLAVRSRTIAPQSLATAVRARVLAVDPEQPVSDVMTMSQRLDDSVAPRRFTLLLLGGFALLALVLASVGIFGVIAYMVTQRTHEVGIRMALGARRGHVLRIFMKQGMALVFCGLAIGVVGAWPLTHVMTAMLFGITATDPLTFAGAASLLTSVALAACWLPALRATAVDPRVALRQE
jgi:putative ABC transport system permease protein